MRKRTIIIGDIHGCLDEFKALIELCKYDQNIDRCIIDGDLVDRGPSSAGCVQLAMDLNAEFVIGNHDDKYIRYARHEEKKTHTGRHHYKNPINLNEEKRKVWQTLTPEMVEYISKGKYVIPLWEYNTLVMHAGVRPGPDPDRREREEYIYTRYIHKDDYRLLNLPGDFSQPPNSVHWTDVYDGTVNIVYGHDVQSLDKPVIKTNDKGAKTFGIDTGCPFGGHLTAIIFNQDKEPEFVQIKAKKAWKDFRLARSNA